MSIRTALNSVCFVHGMCYVLHDTDWPEVSSHVSTKFITLVIVNTANNWFNNVSKHIINLKDNNNFQFKHVWIVYTWMLLGHSCILLLVTHNTTHLNILQSLYHHRTKVLLFWFMTIIELVYLFYCFGCISFKICVVHSHFNGIMRA